MSVFLIFRSTPSVKSRSKPRLRATKAKPELPEPETESEAEAPALKSLPSTETDTWRKPLPYPLDNSSDLLHKLVQHPTDPRPYYKH